MKHIPALLASAALAAGLAACANAQEDGQSTSMTEEPGRCIFVRNIDNYHPIDRNHVVIMDRSEDAYLLGTIQPGCWDLQRSASVGLESAPISICAGQTATLLVSGERCYIRTLEAVASQQAAEALVESRNEEGETAP